MRNFLTFCLLLSCLFLQAEPLFTHNVTGEKKPWTHERFINGSEKFTFVIIPDRTGSERPGVFPDAIKKANMLQPDFIITVGDLIQGPTDILRQSKKDLREQWKELNSFTSKSEAPFFHVVGNHDISLTREGFPLANENSRDVWMEFSGNHTYYYFTYKNVLFLCLNSMEGRGTKIPQTDITPEQTKWAIDVLKKHQNVRWTFVFIHQPSACKNQPFLEIEKELIKRKYTLFSGDWHRYIKFKRHGRDYFVLGTAGGVSKLRGKEYGEFDHITHVTVTKKGPVVANLLLDGILEDDVVTPANIKTTFGPLLDTGKFTPAPDGPWKAIVDDYTLQNLIDEDGIVNGYRIQLNGSKKKNCREVIPLDHPKPAARKFRLTTSCRTELPADGKGSFSILICQRNKHKQPIASNGVTIQLSKNWKKEVTEFTTLPETASIELCLAAENLDKNSFGEIRNTYVEDITDYK